VTVENLDAKGLVELTVPIR